MDKFVLVPVEPTEEMIKAMIYADQGAPMFTPIAGVKLCEYREALAAAPAPVFDEAAERAAFEEWYSKTESVLGMRNRFEKDKYDPDEYYFVGTRKSWAAWLACAKRKAGVL